MTTPAGPGSRRGHVRRWVLAAGAAVLLVAAVGVGVATRSPSAGSAPALAGASGASALPSPAAGAAGIDLGPGGFVVQDSPASRWVAAHPDDPRAATVGARIAAQPAALWLTGEESLGNLSTAVEAARRADGTMTLTLYAIPGRDDGLSDPSDVSAAAYRAFVMRVATTIGDTRAVVVVEPDALWFVDRQTPPGTAAYDERLSLLRGVVDTFAAVAPRSRLYLEAGTSSNSVTPERMAELLRAAGVERAAGFAVNVSSFGPESEITAWAQGIRTGLADLGAPGVHYVVDTGRNGNSQWDFAWCNPAGRAVGYLPGLADNTTGRDADLWVKQPGTSDGDCGVGRGTTGGQFMPAVALGLLG